MHHILPVFWHINSSLYFSIAKLKTRWNNVSYVADAPGTMLHKDDMIAKRTHRGFATDNLQRNYALGELTTMANKHRSSLADLLNCLRGQETSNILDVINNNILRERCNKDFMKNVPQLWSDDDVNKAVLTKNILIKRLSF